MMLPLNRVCIAVCEVFLQNASYIQIIKSCAFCIALATLAEELLPLKGKGLLVEGSVRLETRICTFQHKHGPRGTTLNAMS